MENYIFLQLSGVLYPEDKTFLNSKLYKKDLDFLHRLVETTNCSLVIIDPVRGVSGQVLQEMFKLKGFRYANHIMGSIPNSEILKTLIIDSEYYNLHLGNYIEAYIESFIVRPYNRPNKKSIDYEIWEYPENSDPVYKGLRELQLDLDFNYSIICHNNKKGLLDFQAPRVFKTEFKNLSKQLKLLTDFHNGNKY